MKTTVGRTSRIIAGLLLVATLASCSGGSSGSADVAATPADSGLLPTDDGFTFANFGSSASTEVFDTKDLVTMFGKEACVNGVEEPCAPTTQAAAWARMVNEARASGHCEGLAVQAAARFDSKQTPATGELLNAGDVTHGIMRAFATQFLPEVQDATNSWAKKSLGDIVNEIVSSIKTGRVEYSLGLYTPTGGHAVLPYAVQFPSKDLAVIKVYDSNWPGRERYVVVDLAAKKWFFSFNGQDPQEDECAWTGKAGDIDLTPMSVRTSATCPFCGAKTTVAKSVLLIRSTGVEWEVKTKNGTFSPSNGTPVDGTISRGLRSASCNKTVSIPEFILSVDTPDFELTLPETASAYISNGKSVVQIQTNGKKSRKPIKFTQTSVESDDPGTTVTLAANNLATQVTADTTVINFTDTKITVEATIGTETKTVVADVSTPQIIVSTDTGTVVTTTDNVDLTKTGVVIAPDLVPPATKGELPPAEVREAAAAVASTTTTAVATTTTATIAETPQEKPTAVPTTKQLDAVPDAPAGTPMTTKKSYVEGDKVSFTQPGFEPNSWVQVVVSPPTKILQTVQASSTGKVTVSTKMPTNVVSASSLRRPRVTSISSFILCLVSQARGNYDSGDCVTILLASGVTTTVSTATTTPTVAATTTTSTTTVAATTTTTVPTYSLTVKPSYSEMYGAPSITGSIKFSTGGSLVKTCVAFTSACEHKFASGTAVTIAIDVTSTTADYFAWVNSEIKSMYPTWTLSAPPCPEDLDGSTTNGALIRKDFNSSIVGNLRCSWSMTAADKTLAFWVSGGAS